MAADLFGDDNETTEVEEYQNGFALSHWSRIGRMAEYLVCAELTKLGYYVTHVDAPGFDLILVVADASLRVQVRSSTKVKDGYCTWNLTHHVGEHTKVDRRGPGRTLPITKAQADLLALYHHQFGTTFFYRVDEPRGSIKLPASQMKKHVTSESLENALKWISFFGSRENA